MQDRSNQVNYVTEDRDIWSSRDTLDERTSEQKEFIQSRNLEDLEKRVEIQEILLMMESDFQKAQSEERSEIVAMKKENVNLQKKHNI